MVESAKKALDRIYRVLDDSDRCLAGVATSARASGGEHSGGVQAFDAVMDALHDDLNTPTAFAALFQLADHLRSAAMGKDVAGVERCRALLLEAGQLMGFLAADPSAWFQGGADDDLKTRVEALIAERHTARTEKNWPEADRIRAELTALNVEVMDGPTGATWRIKEQA